MSIDAEPQTSPSSTSEDLADPISLERTLAMISSACFTTVPMPPVGTGRRDIEQFVVLSALAEGQNLAELSYTFARSRAIDAAALYGRQGMPGNRAYMKATRALNTGLPLDPTSGLLGQAAQRRVISRSNGVFEAQGKEDKDIFGLQVEDPSQEELDRVETRVDGLLETLLEKCQVTSTNKNAKRNRALVELHLEGFSFPEIQEKYGINSKTATAVWRNFFLQAKWYFDVMGIDEDSIRGNV